MDVNFLQESLRYSGLARSVHFSLSLGYLDGAWTICSLVAPMLASTSLHRLVTSWTIGCWFALILLASMLASGDNWTNCHVDTRILHSFASILGHPLRRIVI